MNKIVNAIVAGTLLCVPAVAQQQSGRRGLTPIQPGDNQQQVQSQVDEERQELAEDKISVRSEFGMFSGSLETIGQVPRHYAGTERQIQSRNDQQQLESVVDEERQELAEDQIRVSSLGSEFGMFSGSLATTGQAPRHNAGIERQIHSRSDQQQLQSVVDEEQQELAEGQISASSLRSEFGMFTGSLQTTGQAPRHNAGTERQIQSRNDRQQLQSVIAEERQELAEEPRE
jgi:flagellar biosynthesis/type III secretory pathway chaperone